MLLYLQKKLPHLFKIIRFGCFAGIIGWTVWAIFVLVRLLELFTVDGGFAYSSIEHYLLGIRYDLVFASIIAIASLVPTVFILHLFPKRRKLLLYLVVVPVGLLSWAVSEYYHISKIPLNQSVLIYSFSEAIFIIKSSVAPNLLLITKGVIVVLSIVFIPRLMLTLSNRWNKFSMVFGLLILAFPLVCNSITPNIAGFKNNKPYYQEINKASYLIKSLVHYKKNFNAKSISDIKDATRIYQHMLPSSQFYSEKYPFVKQRDTSNVLGPFFALEDRKPNIVIIVVESLSRRFSGNDASFGSFTPFLDSLAANGLFWQNFVSTSERTFQVLPSLLASTPYGQKGFMSVIETQPYPNILSLTGFLKHYDYKSRFFYGGWSGFDRMDNFLSYIDVSYILNEKKFNEKCKRIAPSSKGFSWGYPDSELFSQALEVKDSLNQSPFLDIYLTLSMHNPFNPPNSDFWRKKLYEHLETMELTAAQEKLIGKREMAFATMLYTDNCIRDFFGTLKKQDAFSNTIFVICGDHNLYLGDYSAIEKYKVPLLIYSPLLKVRKKFPAVSSTADITPSLVNLLARGYTMKAPKYTHWLGAPLDTAGHFRCNRFIPFMRVDRSINEMLYEELFYSEGRLFKIKESLVTEPLLNDSLNQRMSKLLNEFKVLNNYTSSSTILYPVNFSSIQQSQEGSGNKVSF